MSTWGIMGTGRIARKFAQAVAGSASERVVAAASRDQQRAQAFADELGIGRAYGSYDDLLDDAAVECIYIALPNALHAEWAMAAARAGKHVLCEKPLASNAGEAAQMFEVARQAGTWLMEAFMYRFHPQTRKLQELVAAGAVGTVKLVRASFSFTVVDADNVRLSADLAGGALMDVGCYCVNLARMVVGEAPVRVSASARRAHSGVDSRLVGTLEYPGGALAQIACGLDGSRHHQAQIIGDAGIIDLDEVFTFMPDRPGQIRLRRGSNQISEEVIPIAPADHFRLEAEGFARLVASGHAAAGLPAMPLIETIDNAATIDALLLSAQEGRLVEIGTQEQRVCSVCGGAVKAVVMIEDHGANVGEKPSEVAPGKARMSMGVVYNERYPLDATACTRCGHIDLWVDPGWAASLK